MTRHIVLAIAAAAALLGTGAAQAARVDFSVGIAVPPIAVVAGPGYLEGPGVVGYRAPPPVVYPSVIVAPRPRFWLPPVPRLPPPPWAWHHDGWRDGWRDTGHREDWRDHDRHDGWRDGRQRDSWQNDGHREDGHRDGGHRDDGRDADHRGVRGPW